MFAPLMNHLKTYIPAPLTIDRLSAKLVCNEVPWVVLSILHASVSLKLIAVL